MPVHQIYPVHADLLPRRPSLLRLAGEALIHFADRLEHSRAHRARRFPEQLPDYLRRDLGIAPAIERYRRIDRW